jgi:hypothetical protein
VSVEADLGDQHLVGSIQIPEAIAHTGPPRRIAGHLGWGGLEKQLFV